MWREKERGQPVDSAGQLITGEPFTNIRELKHILATDRHLDFYRTLTEKMLIYALGRGLEYYDVETVDRIVDRLEKSDGRFSALLMGVVESTPFQKRRESAMFSGNEPGTVQPGRVATGDPGSRGRAATAHHLPYFAVIISTVSSRCYFFLNCSSSFNGCHSSILLPSRSTIQPNLP